MKIEKIKKVVCALLGHSNIETCCIGYISCARCHQQVGDTIGGCYKNSRTVGMECGCEACEENYKKLTWKDKLLTLTPKWIEDPAAYREQKRIEKEKWREWINQVQEQRKMQER